MKRNILNVLIKFLSGLSETTSIAAQHTDPEQYLADRTSNSCSSAGNKRTVFVYSLLKNRS